ncbi:DUF2786 domain-containing protein [Acinetobacter celticus]|uniref:DUF2786 domain-containing protein n=1 Tax=Acinetobacter celticus TaxID=1891224 RepID=A0A1C3CV84_9GAMM|nr:DUF2786 domain-containing protein [Acinetobacter celticus]ODA12642.1 hypothetical protein BBP83_08745 [Acinetobacter celticus]
MSDSILRKIKHCEALSKSPNGNEAAVAYKQMQALIKKHHIAYKANQTNFKAGDKVVYIPLHRTDEVLTISLMMDKDHLRYPVAFMGGINACGIIMIRHATPDEIITGKRAGKTA